MLVCFASFAAEGELTLPERLAVERLAGTPSTFTFAAHATPRSLSSAISSLPAFLGGLGA